MKLPRLSILSTAILLFLAAVAPAQQLTAVPYQPTGIYNIGQTVGWKISTAPTGSNPGPCKYTIKKNNWTPIQSGNLDFSTGSAKIEVTSDDPAMIYVQITPSVGLPIALGAAVAPDKIQPSIPRPADFDEFWDSKIKLLNSIPPNPVLTPKESGRSDIDYAIIQMDNINGAHAYGQIAKPKRDGKFPGLVIFQWASPPYPLQKPWVTDRAAEGWLALNIEPHDVLPDQPRSYYNNLPQSLKNYQTIGRDDRDKNYFLQMYLADYRAVDYLASRPDWDGKTLVVIGTSMGGQQSLCVAGLNPKITDVIVNEPSGCDANGPLHARASGYPNWPANDPRVMQTAQYFDAVNFASRITVPSLVAMGFVDTTAPPVGVWTAFNQIQGPKQSAPMIDSPHNNLATAAEQRPYTSEAARWLSLLVKGRKLSINSTSPDQPIERADSNSKLAHQVLLHKAHSGQIDIYFEGDSITRRWDATDPQYRPLQANWNKNFFGRNAADFGWGGDTTQNILWRLTNGELDNVNPKIIVLLAGTNNIGNATPPADDQPLVTSITDSIKAILNLCQQKAPTATIILTAITPRNDNMAVIPTINRINQHLALLADGKRVLFININDKLADSTGKLFPGMTNRDQLHLTAKAYQIWADALNPLFTQLLGPRAATDSAPAPTGDPNAAK